MENENNSKLDALAECVLKQEKDIKKLKKRQSKKDDCDEVCWCSI